LSKKQKFSTGQEESCNGDGPVSEHIIVLRERLQTNGSCQAGELVLSATDGAVQNGDCNLIGSVGHTENGACANGSSNGAVNGFADVLKQPESSHGLRIAEKDLNLHRCSTAAVIAPKNLSHLQSNGLYNFEVPRWDEVEANGNGSIKDVDRLLRTHKTVVPERDSWDEEYDRGKLKKLRSKEKITGFEVNPFQAIANSSKQRLQAEVRSHNVHD
jgi:hypothetical protein